MDDYLEWINQFSLISPPEAFLLHDNAEITTNENNTQIFIEKIMEIESNAESSSENSSKYSDLIDLIEVQIPNLFNY